jgi:hypothetical protein
MHTVVRARRKRPGAGIVLRERGTGTVTLRRSSDGYALVLVPNARDIARSMQSLVRTSERRVALYDDNGSQAFDTSADGYVASPSCVANNRGWFSRPRHRRDREPHW